MFVSGVTPASTKYTGHLSRLPRFMASKQPVVKKARDSLHILLLQTIHRGAYLMRMEIALKDKRPRVANLASYSAAKASSLIPHSSHQILCQSAPAPPFLCDQWWMPSMKQCRDRLCLQKPMNNSTARRNLYWARNYYFPWIAWNWVKKIAFTCFCGWKNRKLITQFHATHNK